MMNILVTGANGQLGQCLRDLVETNDTENKWLWTDVSTIEGRNCDYLDITDAESVKKYFVDNAISICVNCAAYTNVDKAEEDRERAKRLNADAPKNLAEACNIHNSKLIHISTDYVFNGTSFIPLTEDRATLPTSIYGMSKLVGEENIINSGCKYLIFRTAWLYSEYGNNFVKTMIKLIKEKDRINVVNDQIGTPTYARDLAKLIFNIITNNGLWYYDGNRPLEKNGIYHFTNEGVCSWYDFAQYIRFVLCDCCNYDTAKLAVINGIPTKEYYKDNDKPHARRPHYSVLSKEKTKSDFITLFTPEWWGVNVESCVKNIESKVG